MGEKKCEIFFGASSLQISLQRSTNLSLLELSTQRALKERSEPLKWGVLKAINSSQSGSGLRRISFNLNHQLPNPRENTWDIIINATFGCCGADGFTR